MVFAGFNRIQQESTGSNRVSAGFSAGFNRSFSRVSNMALRMPRTTKPLGGLLPFHLIVRVSEKKGVG